jgi:lysyl-tRNA synthetase, class II
VTEEDGEGKPADDAGSRAPFSPPYRFDRTATAAAVVDRWAGLAAGDESGEIVSVAGRVLRLRPQGKLAFAELRDESGAVQLLAFGQSTDDFDSFVRLHLGDWIGARGEVVRTPRGELSVKVADWALLAQARRSFGDKWRGIADVEIRYRQREVDLWANERSRGILRVRSRLIQRLRERLWADGFVEMETPILHPVAGGATAKPFVTHHNALDIDLHLRIAPEIYLKRLVIGGFEKIFEIGRMFRNEGISPRHNPEFTSLEAYQAYADYRDMADLFERLVAGVAEDLVGTTRLTYQGRPLDLTPPWRRATVSELIEERTGLRLDVHSPLGELQRAAVDHAVPVEEGWGPAKLLLELYEKTAEATLWDPVFVMDYPVEATPLQRRHRDDPALVERFEIVIAGMEMGVADTELVDPDDQRARFFEQAAARAAGDEEATDVDHEYLRAMEYGLPPLAGLGIGIDRLVMLLADVASIREVIAFPTLRPERLS